MGEHSPAAMVDAPVIIDIGGRQQGQYPFRQGMESPGLILYFIELFGKSVHIENLPGKRAGLYMASPGEPVGGQRQNGLRTAEGVYDFLAQIMKGAGKVVLFQSNHGTSVSRKNNRHFCHEIISL